MSSATISSSKRSLSSWSQSFLGSLGFTVFGVLYEGLRFEGVSVGVGRVGSGGQGKVGVKGVFRLYAWHHSTGTVKV